MNEPDLDKYCKKIVAVLTIMSREYRFNTLLKFLNKHGVKMTKPTLSTHLKHLVKREIVKRKQMGIQEVVYSMNYEKFKNLGEISAITREAVSKFHQQEREVKFLPVGKKIDYLHVLAVLQSLVLLKLEILTISKPENQFEYSLSQYSLLMHFGTITNWMLDYLRDNPRELEDATGELTDLSDQYMKLLLPDKSETEQHS